MNQENKTIAIITKPEAEDIFAYKISTTFFNKTGFNRLLISAAFMAGAAIFAAIGMGRLTIFLFAIGLLNPLVTPLMQLAEAKRLAPKLPRIIYTFTGEKFSVNDGTDRLQMNWSEFTQVVASKKRLLIYISEERAFVIPKNQMEENDWEFLMELVKANSELCPTKYRNYL